jgi:hypothetical protein
MSALPSVVPLPLRPGPAGELDRSAGPRTPAEHRLEPVPDGSPRRGAAEALVRAVFHARFAARVGDFMPELLGLYDAGGRLRAAVGTRRASAEPLYLEQYLDAPIERLASAELGVALARGSIVEVGHLAARRSGLMPTLFGAVALRLSASGYRCIAFTATRHVRVLLQRMGLEVRPLGAADPARLGAAARDWGSYYDNEPEVVVGLLPRWSENICMDAGPLAALRELLAMERA